MRHLDKLFLVMRTGLVVDVTHAFVRRQISPFAVALPIKTVKSSTFRLALICVIGRSEGLAPASIFAV